MKSFITFLEKIYLGSIIVIGVAWVVNVPQYFGFSLISAEWIGAFLSVGIAAAFLRHPYQKRAGVLELFLVLQVVLLVLKWRLILFVCLILQ